VAFAAFITGSPAITALFQAKPGTQAAPTPSVAKKRLQAAFESLHDAGKFPGGTAGFVLADGTSFAIATGVSDPTAPTPMTISDRMLMGSVGKTYVAAVALQLVQERRLALTDKLGKWLGSADWFARLPNGRDITVRMLLNHTSGLAGYESSEKFTADVSRQPDKTWRPEELIAYILDSKPPFAAGSGWQFSDTNYIVLGMIIERVTGSTYYAELGRRLLVPFKLKDTVPSDSRTIPGLVPGFAGPDSPFGGTDRTIRDGRFAINPQFEWTGGGLASTSLDLARWGKVLYEGRAFNKLMLGEMVQGVAAKLGPGIRYGLGVMIRPTPLGISYGHSGSFPGYLTEMAYFPDLRVAIAVQVNSSAPGATGKPLATYLADFAQILAGKPTI
jgi:D-alanyl-D-alanine carboxypeptidase